jgi:hypothetical protein
VPKNILQSLPERYDLYQHIIDVFRGLEIVKSATRSGACDDSKFIKSSAFVNSVDSELYRSVSLPELEGNRGRRRHIQQSCYLVSLIYVAFVSRQYSTEQLAETFIDRVHDSLFSGSRSWAMAVTSLFRLLLSGDVLDSDSFAVEISRLMDATVMLSCAAARDIKGALLDFYLHDFACEGRLQALWKRRMTTISG